MRTRISSLLTAIAYAVILMVSGLTSPIHGITPTSAVVVADEHSDHGSEDGDRCSGCNCCNDFGCNGNHVWACGDGDGCSTHLFVDCSNQENADLDLPL